MKQLLLLALCGSLMACGGTRTPAQELERQGCLLETEAEHDQRADEECLDAGLGWETCPHRAEIMASLEKAQKECRNVR